MADTLMTDQAATTTEGQAASQGTAAASTEGQQAQGGQQAGQQQQATEGQTAQGQQAQDGQTEGDKSSTEEKAEAKTEGAPEKYEFKAVEGAEVTAETLAEFSEVAKELNLPQDAAQKILDKMAPALARRQAEAIEGAKTQWAESARADKEFGGDKLAENLSVAKKALETFGSPELRTLLNESGLGNHPEIIRAFYRAGKAISEDRFVNGQSGKGAAGNPLDYASKLYPNQQ